MNPDKKAANHCAIELGSCSPENTNQKVGQVNSNDTLSKPTLIYYYDALCGWCYGFSSVLAKVEQAYGDQLDIRVISGGLFSGSRVGYINEIAPYIKAGAYKSVELRTGVPFGEAFLAAIFGKGELVLNSLPPAIALCIVKEKYPEQELQFAEMLLKAVYRDGLNPIDVDGLAEYAEKLGFDKAEFKLKMQAAPYKEAAEKEFEKFGESQFSGMPGLVLKKGEQQVVLANGYTSFDELQMRLESFIS